jgi:hypothetical protein
MEKKVNIYKVPKAVYYQCVWLLKDIERLRKIEAAGKVPRGDDELVFFVDEEKIVLDETVINLAREKLRCVRKALQMLPAEYRQSTLDCIVLGVPFADTAHYNTWRKWRQIFICELAKNLHLI